MTALHHIMAATVSESFVFNCIRNWHKVSGRNLVTLILLVQIAAIQLFGTPKLWGRELFPIDRKGVVERSDIILARPALLPTEAMPLGNGRLGVAVWSQDGFTAQLNRGDTFPKRLSPGQIIIPTLDKLAEARDYRGRLNLYTGEFEQSGGGMTAVTYVDEALDVLVVDVKGADPKRSKRQCCGYGHRANRR